MAEWQPWAPLFFDGELLPKRVAAAGLEGQAYTRFRSVGWPALELSFVSLH